MITDSLLREIVSILAPRRRRWATIGTTSELQPANASILLEESKPTSASDGEGIGATDEPSGDQQSAGCAGLPNGDPGE
ncbi:MAG: hypothetical protein ABI923_12945 [bacterium]